MKIIPPLTALQIDRALKARNGKERIELRDGMVRGLTLRAGPARAQWSLQAFFRGGNVRLTIGPYPAIGLAAARKRAQEKRNELEAMGVAQTDKAHPAGPTTLSELTAAYGKAVASIQASWPKAEMSIRHVLARLIDEPLYKLDARTIQRQIDAHPAKPSAAQCVRFVRPMLKWARKRGYCAVQAEELEQPRGANRMRGRVLSQDELRAILQHLTFTGKDAAARMMLLTLARREEVCGASLSEFDLEKGIWTIPAARSKNRQENVIPLSAPAVSLVQFQLGEKPFATDANWDRWQKQIFKKTGTSGWHRHDLRRTGATLLGGMGVAPHVVEAVLGHTTLHSRLAAVYNKDRYEDEQALALQKLADYYASLSDVT